MKYAGSAQRLERTAIVRWIDRNFAGWPYRTNWHWIVWIVPLSLLTWAGWTTATISMAVGWSVLWGGLVAWRGVIWLAKIERKMRRRKRRN
jgi:hypothetical protein